MPPLTLSAKSRRRTSGSGTVNIASSDANIRTHPVYLPVIRTRSLPVYTELPWVIHGTGTSTTPGVSSIRVWKLLPFIGRFSAKLRSTTVLTDAISESLISRGLEVLKNRTVKYVRAVLRRPAS